jgi:lipopolysaccharide export system permease protein
LRIVSDAFPPNTPGLPLNLLDRYIFKSVLFTCLAAVGVFAFILMLGNFVRDLIAPMLSGQVGAPLALELIFLLFLTVAPYALPMGTLTGVLLTLGRISADSEVTAMRAAGVSLIRIARPIFIVGVLGTAFALYANFEAMPKGRLTFERELGEAIRTTPLTLITPKTFIRQFKGKVIYVGERVGNIVHDVWWWQLDANGNVTQFIRAESGHIDYDEDSYELVFTPLHVQVETRDAKKPEDFSTESYLPTLEKFDPLRFSVEALFGRERRQQKLREMTLSELAAEEARVTALPFTPDKAKDYARAVMKVRLARQEKFTLAFAVFSFALVAVPLGIRVSRRETSANLGVAVLLALGYYMLTIMVGWLDRHPEYHPDLLLWVPNVIFVGLGVWLMRRVETSVR